MSTWEIDIKEREPLLTASGVYSIASVEHPDRNEDHGFRDGKKGLYGLFDGAGKYKRAEEASYKASEVLYEFLTDPRYPLAELIDTKVEETIVEALKHSNDILFKEFEGAGVTTGAFVFARESKFNIGDTLVTVANIGDSSVFVFDPSGERLAKVSIDNSYAAEFFDTKMSKALDSWDGSEESIASLDLDSNERTWLLEGAPRPSFITKERANVLIDNYATEDFTFSKEERAWLEEVVSKCPAPTVLKDGVFRTRNIIRGSLGAAAQLKTSDIHITTLKNLPENCRFIIVSDGVTDNLTRAEIHDILKHNKNKNSQEVSELLVKRASLVTGSRYKPDDITCVTVDVI